MLNSTNLLAELRKRVTHIFSTLRSRSLHYREQLVKDVCYQHLYSYQNSYANVIFMIFSNFDGFTPMFTTDIVIYFEDWFEFR